MQIIIVFLYVVNEVFGHTILKGLLEIEYINHLNLIYIDMSLFKIISRIK